MEIWEPNPINWEDLPQKKVCNSYYINLLLLPFHIADLIIGEAAGPPPSDRPFCRFTLRRRCPVDQTKKLVLTLGIERSLGFHLSFFYKYFKRFSSIFFVIYEMILMFYIYYVLYTYRGNSFIVYFNIYRARKAGFVNKCVYINRCKQ